MVFRIFGCLFVKKIENNVSACLRKLFRKPPVLLKIVSEADHECTLDKSNRPKRAKRKPDQKFVGALEQVLELVSVFKDVSRTF
jgi:hypothetical protein